MKAKTKGRKVKEAEELKKTEKPIVRVLDVEEQHGEPYTFKMVKIWVNKNSINQFHVLSPPFGHARYIRQGKVSALIALMLKLIHYDSTLILERINGGSGGFRIIDGAHRWFAMKKAVEKLEKISFYAGVYSFNDDASEADKKRIRSELFTKHNIGTIQSTADFISSRQDQIPMFDRIAGRKKNIPCNIYGAVINDKGEKVKDPIWGDTLKFKNVVGGYFSGKRGKKFSGGYTGSGEQFIKDCRGEGSIKKPLSEEDVKEMEYTWDTIASAYNLKPPFDFLEKGAFLTSLSKTTPIYVLMRLILQNKRKFTQEQIINRLQRDTVKEAIRIHSKMGGREASKNCHIDLHYRLNKGYEDEPKEMFLPILTKEEQVEEKAVVQDIYKKQEWKESAGTKIVEEDIEELEMRKGDKSQWKNFKGKYK